MINKTYKIVHSKFNDIFVRFNLDDQKEFFDLEINRIDISSYIKTANNSANTFFKLYLFTAKSINLIKNGNGIFIRFNYENLPNPEFNLELTETRNEIFRDLIINQIISNKNKSITKKQLNLIGLIKEQSIFIQLPIEVILLIIEII